MRLRKIPDYGSHMLLKDFVDCCNDGVFIDYDGAGYYATETEESDICANPSDIVCGNIRTDFSHVMWYNK
jgi:hypothetical protein